MKVVEQHVTCEFRCLAFSWWGMGVPADQAVLEVEGILEPELPDILGRNPFSVVLSLSHIFLFIVRPVEQWVTCSI